MAAFPFKAVLAIVTFLGMCSQLFRAISRDLRSVDPGHAARRSGFPTRATARRR